MLGRCVNGSEWASSFANHCKVLGGKEAGDCFSFWWRGRGSGGGMKSKLWHVYMVGPHVLTVKTCTFWLKYRYTSSDTILKCEHFLYFWFKRFSNKPELPEFVAFYENYWVVSLFQCAHWKILCTERHWYHQGNQVLFKDEAVEQLSWVQNPNLLFYIKCALYLGKVINFLVFKLGDNCRDDAGLGGEGSNTKAVGCLVLRGANKRRLV